MILYYKYFAEKLYIEWHIIHSFGDKQIWNYTKSMMTETYLWDLILNIQVQQINYVNSLSIRTFFFILYEWKFGYFLKSLKGNSKWGESQGLVY